ncbi:MAG: Crp/Fnr family transcriptional regulator [Oscillospiraceae bacterium]
MRKYTEILKKCTLFDGITDDELTEKLSCLNAKVKHYAKNQIIISEGQRVTDIGIVLSGAVQIVSVDYFGNRNIVTQIEPSHIFGEAFVCAEVMSVPISAAASEDSEIMLIDGHRILCPCCNSCGSHKQLIANLMKNLALKNLTLNRKIEITSKRTTREKLMAYLLWQAKSRGSDSFTIPYDRQELADFLQVDRSGLSAEISKLRREGILKCDRSRFTLL